jgi:hypothetical protein
MRLVGSLRSWPGEVLQWLDHERGIPYGVEPKPRVGEGQPAARGGIPVPRSIPASGRTSQKLVHDEPELAPRLAASVQPRIAS